MAKLASALGCSKEGIGSIVKAVMAVRVGLGLELSFRLGLGFRSGLGSTGGVVVRVRVEVSVKIWVRVRVCAKVNVRLTTRFSYRVELGLEFCLGLALWSESRSGSRLVLWLWMCVMCVMPAHTPYRMPITNKQTCIYINT